MNQTTKILLGIVILAFIVWGIVSLSKPQPASGEPIRIGAIMILSGDGAAWGENAQKGINLAVKEFNEDSRRKAEVIFEDTGGDTKRAVSAYRKLVDVDKVNAVIGPLFQAEVAAISPLVAQDNVPVVTPSYAPIQNRPNPRNPLMIWMDPSIEAARMAEYVYQQGVRRIAVIGTRDSWENEVSDAFARSFSELGGNVISKEIVQPDISDIRLTVTKSISQNPEAVFLGTYYQFVPAVQRLSDFGFKGKLYGIEVDSYLAGETQPLSNGLEFISPESYGVGFIDKFEKEYGQKPGIPAGQAYDATKILLDFLTKHDDQDGVLRAMEELERYEGVSGDIVVTYEHKTFLPTAIFQLNQGNAQKIDK